MVMVSSSLRPVVVLLVVLLSLSGEIGTVEAQGGQQQQQQSFPSVESFASAFTLAFERVQQNGTIGVLYTSQLDPVTNAFLLDGWPTFQGNQDAKSLAPPPRVPGTVLDAVLSRGTINMCDSAGDSLPWLFTPEQSGIAWETGAIGDVIKAVVLELGAMYNVPLLLNLTVTTDDSAALLNISTSDECFKMLAEGKVDMMSTFFGVGSLYGRQRRNIAFQRTSYFQTDISYLQVWSNTSIRSMTALQISVDENTKLCTAGEGSRQSLQSLFSQLPVENILDFVDTDPLIEAFENGTCFAIFETTILNGTNAFPSGTLNPGSGFFRRDNPIDPNSWRGNEQLALAFEAALSESAFNGGRRIALAQVPNVAFASDCNLNPITFQYPTPVVGGTLDRIISTGNVTVGQLEADELDPIQPWYGGPYSIHRVVNSIFGTISIYYNVPRPIHVNYKNYSSFESLLSALKDGEIDMTVPYFSGGYYLNGTYDIFQFRQGCSVTAMQYIFYYKKTLPNAVNTAQDLTSLAASSPAGSITVAIHEQRTADAYRTTNPYLGAFTFKLYSTVKDAINAVTSGEVDYALLPSNTEQGASSLASFISRFYRPLAPFFRKDIVEPRPLFDRVKYIGWNDPGAIVVMIATILCMLLAAASLATFFALRQTPIVKVSPLLFLVVELIGFVFGFGMIFTYIGKLHDASCALRPWLGGLGFALVFSPMIAKQYRLARILHNTALVSTSIPPTLLLSITGALVAIEVVILILWTAISSARLRAAVHVNSNREAFYICSSDKQWVFIGLQAAYVTLMLSAGFVLSFIIRKVVSRVAYKEMLWVNYSFVAGGFWVILFCVATGFLWHNVIGYFVASFLAILFMVLTLLCLLVLPKLYVLFFVKGGREASGSTAGNSSSFSTDFKPDANEL